MTSVVAKRTRYGRQAIVASSWCLMVDERRIPNNGGLGSVARSWCLDPALGVGVVRWAGLCRSRSGEVEKMIVFGE